jgi:hypothetical protein
MTHLTLGLVAALLSDAHNHIEAHHIRTLFLRGRLPEPPRVGRFRVVSLDQVPEIRRALVEAGYLKPTPAEVSSVAG